MIKGKFPSERALVHFLVPVSGESGRFRKLWLKLYRYPYTFARYTHVRTPSYRERGFTYRLDGCTRLEREIETWRGYQWRGGNHVTILARFQAKPVPDAPRISIYFRSYACHFLRRVRCQKNIRLDYLFSLSLDVTVLFLPFIFTVVT